jgi:hypothetical protein
LQDLISPEMARSRLTVSFTLQYAACIEKRTVQCMA